jgi:hypothetical protein
MNGSEEGEVLPAAVLSGAPIELEARTVRYDQRVFTSGRQRLTKQHLPPCKASNSIRRLARAPVAHGLGYSLQRPPMGESFNGLAILGRFHARHTHKLQEQGGRHSVRGEAGIRILCPGAEQQENCPESVRE